MPSRLDDVLTTLVATFTTALPGVNVYDGPPVTSPGDADLVIVGHDATPDSTADVTVEQSYVDLACTRRQETGEVVCCVVSQTGDTDLNARRSAAFVLLAACEAALVADMTLGGLVRSAQFDRGTARQMQNQAGSAVVASFTVAYRASI
jgi:hypothetical protein